MWIFRRSSHQDRLAALWDDLLAPHSEPTTPASLQPIDPELVKTIEQLHANDDSRLPDADFLIQLEHKIMDTAHTMQPAVTPLRLTSSALPNGRTMPEPAPWRPEIGFRRKRHRWAFASIAAALLIVLVGAGGYIAFEPSGDRVFSGIGDDEQIVPAAQLTPPGVPMLGGDPARTGIMPGPGPLQAPAVKWSYEVGEGIDSSPIIVDGVIYQGVGDIHFMDPSDRPGAVVAVDIESGELLWEFATDSPAGYTPAAANGHLFVTDTGGTLYAIDATTGEEVWTYPTGLEGGSSPAIENGVVYFTTGTSGISNPALANGSVFVGGGQWHAWNALGNTVVHAVDTETGEGRWTFSDFPQTGGAIYALDAVTGDVQWRYEGDPIAIEPATDGDGVFFTDYSRIYALDASTGAVRWEVQSESDFIEQTTLAVADGRVVLHTYFGVVAAFAAETGAELWSVQPEAYYMNSGVTIADDVVYVANDNGIVFAFSSEDGRELWRFAMPDTYWIIGAPLVIDSAIYLGGSATDGPFGPGLLLALD